MVLVLLGGTAGLILTGSPFGIVGGIITAFLLESEM